ncbi:MAG: DUF1194 domain-containing protein [Alphaproteobacteria bacterium]|jgi:hypothetical protein|nr:DUF1194 domain-containing protein [Alphaproteobacteria bacterium]
MSRRLAAALLVAWSVPFLLRADAATLGGADAQVVDLELVLTIDCSYSVDDREFLLQTSGLAKAFADPEVIAAIEAGPKGAIAVSVMQWASWDSQVVAVPWTIVASGASAERVAARLVTMRRKTEVGGTSISAAIDRASAYFAANPAKGKRRVIDISSDGRNNSGPDVRQARDGALAKGITINGLAILNEVPTLNYYFNLYVVGGKDAFVVSAAGYDDYVDAIRRKLLREITGNKLSQRTTAPLPRARIR